MILTGDCLEVMPTLDAGSVDAVVTDPPYGLEFMGREWDKLGGDDWRTRGGFSKPGIGARDTAWTSFGAGDTANATCATCGGRMRGARKCSCETPDWRVKGSALTDPRPAQARRMQDWHQRWATEALRVAKPGAYLLAFGGTRTYHRLTCAIEDAGWIIRDCLVWAYASGFPKSRALLKPAWEPIVMARKPGPLRELAIDACRIPGAVPSTVQGGQRSSGGLLNAVGGERGTSFEGDAAGRWPANVILTSPIFDGDTPGVVGGGDTGRSTGGSRGGAGVGWGMAAQDVGDPGYGDSGTYSRFFILPKADRAEREPILGGLPTSIQPKIARRGKCVDCGRWMDAGETSCPCGGVFEYESNNAKPRANSHPTVKPLDLMRHLVRLVTPTGGTVLDPFLGSGTTALAAELEGFPWIGIEREAEYVAIAEARLNGTQRGLGLPA